MEYIIAAVMVVFLCLGCLFVGIKIGKSLREVRTIERMIENGNVTTETFETVKVEKPSKPEEGMTHERAAQNWQEFEPKYTER